MSNGFGDTAPTTREIDDHNVVRLGLKHLLEMEEHLQVVGEASDAEEALALAQSIDVDVIVTDLSLPDHDGIWLIQALKQALRSSRPSRSSS